MWTISIQDMLKRDYQIAYKSLPRPYLLEYPNDRDGSCCKKYNHLVDRYNELIQCSPVTQLSDWGRLLTYSLVIEDHYILKTKYNYPLKYHPEIWRMFRELVKKIINKQPEAKNEELKNTVRFTQELVYEIAS